MNLNERKVYVEEARRSAPDGLNIMEDSTQEVPREHDYAVVEILEEAEHGTTFLYVATGNREGICWAWVHAQENHPKPDSLKILDLRRLGVQPRIEIH